MTFSGTLLIVLLAAGVLMVYVTLRREMQSQIDELRKLVSDAKAQPAATSTATLAAPAPAPAPAAASKLELVKKESVAAPVATPMKAAKDEVTPEILAIIAAAVAQFVGAAARIRSTRVIPITESNAWAQQGRVIIQASHNLAVR